MSRKKKVADEPKKEELRAEIPEIKPEPAPAEEPKIASTATQVPNPEEPYNPLTEIRNLIKQTMISAPKRNDGTTMPSPVTLRCSAGDMYFIMYHFDAVTVERLWAKVRHMTTPEGFVNCLYTTMGLTPPKLYLYRKDIVIS